MLARGRSLVVIVAVVVLTSTVLPAAALPHDSRPSDRRTVEPTTPLEAFDGNASPVERKRAAVALVESMDVGWHFQARQRERTVERLNGTLSVYRDGYRVSDPAVFRADRSALGTLATIAWTNDTAAEEAANLVVVADLATVTTSIADAKVARERVAGRLEDPRDRRRFERAIDRAVRARDRARRALRRDGWGSWRFANHRRALVHVGHAWFHAQRALDVLDDATPPMVTIETRTDPARDGTEPLARPIRGNVSAVRAYALGNLSVAVNGTAVRSVPLDAGTAPGRNASFEVNVTLDRAVVEVTAAVSEPGSRGPDWRQRRPDGWWSRFDRLGDPGPFWGYLGPLDRDRPGRWASDSAEASTGRDTVRFDGDGLPDTYETTVVGTDPLDPDSDAPSTDPNEADDGLPDGGEDFDDDGLITYAESELGTDPFSSDSDADGLPDRFEASLPGLADPTDADVDDDGVLDGAEDFDEDGLSAAEERAAGTSVTSRDSDRDGLSDGNETLAHGTSPTDADTDGDGLGDAEELSLDADPLVADTDGDGVVDGNETYDSTLTDEATGVRVSLSGRGNVAGGVDVEAIDQPLASEFLAAPVVRLENRTSFETANVTLPLTGNTSTDEPANLSVYTWSPGNDRAWHALDTTVDVANGTATATVSSFSLFTVMRGDEWEAAITDTVSPGWPRLEAFDDLSGWTVDGDAEVHGGAMVLSSSKAPALDPDIVVAADGSADFERIQPAVDAAAAGQTILVRSGRYPEEVVLDESINLVGRNATIDGRTIGGEEGIRLVGAIAPRVSGLTITGFERGIEGRSRNVDVHLSSVEIRGNRVGIDARQSGRWTLGDVSVVDNRFRGVVFAEFDGDLRISGGELSGNGDTGLFLASFVGSASISDAVFSDNGNDGLVLFLGTSCECTLRGVEISGNGGYGLTAHDNSRPIRLENVDLRRNQIGLYVKGETDVELTNVDLIEHKYGIYSGVTTGNIELSDVTIVGDPNERAMGIQAGASEADWRLERVAIRDNRYVGVRGAGATGEWILEDVRLSNNGVNVLASEATGAWGLIGVRVVGARYDGIDARHTAGSWTLRDVVISSNAWDGLRFDESTASWDVERTRIVSNGRLGVRASGSAGAVAIHRSRFGENGDGGLAAPNATPPVDASENWWGQPSGPEADQTTGNVVTDPFCETPGCQDTDGEGGPNPQARSPAAGTRSASADGARREALDVGAGSRSVAQRATRLPADAAIVTVAVRMKGHAADRSTARVSVVGDAGETIVGEVVSSSGDYRTETANLTDFAGQTVTLVAETAGDAELSIDWIDFVVDTDGDGLRDSVERADLGMPTGPRPGAPLDSLDPTNPDTDGDGLLDGQELTGVTVERESPGLGGSLSFRADAAAADPTAENSDGGGLNDSEEVEAGSDPFVLETLVVGYTIPTMTHGPGDSLEDRQPMTVGQSNGLHTGPGRDSNLIAWPSRQFFDPLFCIKELTAGPGCAPEWMSGTEPEDDKLYVYLPFVAYAESDEPIGEVPYRMEFESIHSGTLVKSENQTGRVAPGESRMGYVVFELPELRAAEEGQPAVFRSVGRVTMEANLGETAFRRKHDASVGRGYSVSTSTLLPATEEMLDDTQFVLEEGMNIALAAEAGATVAIETGSRTRGALVFLYELALSRIETQPKSIEDVALNNSLRGIGSFKNRVNQTETDVQMDVFGDGVIRPAGPTVVRQN